jgi:hypothetical protein
MRRWRLIVVVFATVAILWLMRTASPPRPIQEIEPARPAEALLGSAFDAKQSGELRCRATWDGPPPNVEPISIRQSAYRVDGKSEVPNPNAPRVSKEKGLADCVVSLKKVDFTRCKAWNLPPVSVEPTIAQLKVKQGDRVGGIGVVRRGEPIELIAREDAKHSLRGRGAAFFTQMLFAVNEPVRRELSGSGVVELSSGSGYFWHRGYLVVSDHPYVGVTDESGVAILTGVPAGDYEAIFWKANWHMASLDRDPELIRYVRMHFHEPVQKLAKVRLNASEKNEVDVTFAANDFKP